MIVLKFVGIENLLGATLLVSPPLASLFFFLHLPGYFLVLVILRQLLNEQQPARVPRLRCLNTPDVAFLNVIILSSGSSTTVNKNNTPGLESRLN